MKKHFVIFLSPGTLFAEQTEQEIESWDTQIAIRIARTIKERHGATPYGFQFTTRERKASDFDSKEIERSGVYYLGGTVLTLEQLKIRADPKDEILIRNMETNGFKSVIENNNSWKWVQPLRENDVVLRFEPNPKVRK